MNINAFLQKDYENEPPSGPKKQTQFKPNLVRRRRIPKGQHRLPENLATPGGVGTGGEPLQLQGSLGNIYKQRALSIFLGV